MASPAWRRYRQAGRFCSFHCEAQTVRYSLCCVPPQSAPCSVAGKKHVSAFPCGYPAPASEFIHQITMRFRGCAGRFENIALVVFQRFQPGSDVTFMLYLAINPQIRHQKGTSQLRIGSGGSCLRENMPLPPRTERDSFPSSGSPCLPVPIPLRGFSVPACRALWHVRHRTIRLRRLAAATCFQSGVSFISASLRL